VAVLCALVRDNAHPTTTKPAHTSATPETLAPRALTDIQAAPTVVGTRDTSHDGSTTVVDLDHTQLAAADLTGAGFVGTDFVGANLARAFIHADLAPAFLMGADLTGANIIIGTDLREANITGANLTGATGLRVSINR